MARYVGGTEIQLRLAPLYRKARGPDSVTSWLFMSQLTDELVAANNKMRLYGIPAANLKENSVTSWLFNGGLLYADLGYPEYATPECSSLDDLAKFEWAGRRLVGNLLKLLTFGHPSHVVFANNTDHYNHTCAYHENYLAKGLSTEIPALLPFLVTRPIFAGAGMVLTAEMRLKLESRNWYSIAQRSLVTHAQSMSTISEGRLIVGNYSYFVGPNRHNPHLLHVTGGDANFLASTTKLKIGATALVHQMIEDGWQSPDSFDISDVEAMVNLRKMALAPTFRWQYQTDRLDLPATVIQRVYLKAAKKRFSGRDADTDWTLQWWEKTLDQLETDPLKATWLDWVKKYQVLSHYKARGWSEQALIRTDLSFHAVDPTLNILRLLGGSGVLEDDITGAMTTPPQNSRAAGRGVIIRALDKVLESRPQLPTIHWDGISYGKIHLLTLNPQETYLKEAAEFAKELAALP